MGNNQPIGKSLQELIMGKAREEKGRSNTYQNYKQERMRFLEQFYTDILVNRFTYENAPTTLNTFLIEQALFKGALGVAVGKYNGNIRVLGLVGADGSRKTTSYATLTTGLYGGMGEVNPFIDKADFDKLKQIDPTNPEAGGDYVIIANKDSAMYMGTSQSDSQNIAMYCEELAEIDRLSYAQRQLFQTSMVLIGDKGQIDNAMFMEQWGAGASAISVGENFKPGNIQPFTPQSNPTIQQTLQLARNNKEAELWTYMGINNFVAQKKERSTQAEGEAKFAAITLASNVSLNPRKRAINVLNEHFGLDINVHFAYEEIENVTGNGSQNREQQ